MAEARASGVGARAKETKLYMKMVKYDKKGVKTLNLDDPYFQEYMDRYEDLGPPHFKRADSSSVCVCVCVCVCVVAHVQIWGLGNKSSTRKSNEQIHANVMMQLPWK